MIVNRRYEGKRHTVVEYVEGDNSYVFVNGDQVDRPFDTMVTLTKRSESENDFMDDFEKGLRDG